MISTAWRPIAGYEEFYEVSSDGEVRSFDRIDVRGQRVKGRMLAPFPAGRYLAVELYRDGTRSRRYVHHLVAAAFHGPRPEGQHVRHLDGNRTNNRAGNLAYGTPSENELDKVRLGTHHLASRTHCAKGHPLSGGNLIAEPTSNGGTVRRCRICRLNEKREYGREYMRRHRARLRAEAASWVNGEPPAPAETGEETSGE